MGFNTTTLMSLPFGLLLPLAVFIFLLVSKKKKDVSFDPIFMGFGAFFASIAAVAVVFIAANTLFLSGLTFADETSGMTTVGTILVVLVIAIFIVCESFKMSVIRKFQNADKPRVLSSVGFSAGVVLAQNVVVFVALNIFTHYEMNMSYAIFSGAILLFTGIMYTVLSFACEIMLKEGFKAPSYALSAIYYLFWISVVLLIAFGADSKLSSVLIYTVSAFFFVLSFILSGVFVFRVRNNKKVGENK